MTYNFNVMN